MFTGLFKQENNKRKKWMGKNSFIYYESEHFSIPNWWTRLIVLSQRSINMLDLMPSFQDNKECWAFAFVVNVYVSS